jgi:hypothetical protein
MKRLLLFSAPLFLMGLLSTSAALASPPSPDADPSCGGNCQTICINGCDTNYSYVWQEARCGGPHPTWADASLAAATFLDTKGQPYCSDGYNCDYGPCGRVGERACNTFQCASCFNYGNIGDEMVVGGDGRCHKLNGP